MMCIPWKHPCCPTTMCNLGWRKQVTMVLFLCDTLVWSQNCYHVSLLGDLVVVGLGGLGTFWRWGRQVLVQRKVPRVLMECMRSYRFMSTVAVSVVRENGRHNAMETGGERDTGGSAHQ